MGRMDSSIGERGRKGWKKNNVKKILQLAGFGRKEALQLCTSLNVYDFL